MNKTYGGRAVVLYSRSLVFFAGFLLAMFVGVRNALASDYLSGTIFCLGSLLSLFAAIKLALKAHRGQPPNKDDKA